MSSTPGVAEGAKLASFRDVLEERPIGFTLVTVASAEPIGFVGLSVAHVSAKPPLPSTGRHIAAALQRSLRRFSLLRV
jgi:hypothetical protein